MRDWLTKATMGLSLMVLAADTARSERARNCAARQVVLERLHNTYGESRQAIGLGSNSIVIEVFASFRTGTWTITATLPNGLTCLVASGQAYEALAEDVPEGDPA